ncbi:MAG TPA: ATP-dependent helicase, partial [Gammaproteobacteria bacterium]
MKEQLERTSRSKRRTKAKSRPRPARVTRARKPGDMSLESWQVTLRRQFAAEQKFRVRDVGGQAIFSDFEVTNPQTKRTYRVAIRGEALGVNFCACPDFAVNTLGTCKHIEFLLGKLRRKRGGKAALAAGYRPAFSEVYLRYGARRQVVFQAGTQCPESLNKLAAKFFRGD